MTDTPEPDLLDLSGVTVVGSTIALRNAGDGLSEALEIDPMVLHHGQTVYVVIEARVSSIAFPALSSDTPTLVRREAVLRAGTSKIVDEDLVGDMIAAQRERVEAARARARLEAEAAAKSKPGAQQTIVAPDGTTDPDAIIDPDAHAAGEAKRRAKKAPAKRAPRSKPTKRGGLAAVPSP